MNDAERERLKAEIKSELVETLAPVIIRAVDRAVDVRFRSEAPPPPSNLYQFSAITPTHLRAVRLRDPAQFFAQQPRTVRRLPAIQRPEEESPEDAAWALDHPEGA